jgi:CheY-like chemotaxis protein
MAAWSSLPRLIILDLWMPWMNGVEFCFHKEGYERWAEIPVLVITASRALPRELGPLGLTHILRKPLNLEEVLSKVEELLQLPLPGDRR